MSARELDRVGACMCFSEARIIDAGRWAGLPVLIVSTCANLGNLLSDEIRFRDDAIPR